MLRFGEINTPVDRLNLKHYEGLEVFTDSCTVEEFAQNAAGQHVLIAYGKYVEEIKDFCKIMDIELVM